MLLSQRPLTGSDQDRPLVLATRMSLAEGVAGRMARGLNTLVLGRPGSGRTSFLNLVARSLDSQNVWGGTCRVDARPWNDARDLLAAVEAALGQDPRAGRVVNVDPWQALPRASDPMRAYEVRDEPPLNEHHVLGLVRAAEEVSGGGRIAVLLDNLAPESAHDLFGRFRDTVWRAPVVWLGIGDASRDGYVDPPADAFWDKNVWLRDLDEKEAAELLQRRIQAAAPGDPDAARLGEDLLRLVDRLHRPSPREVLRAAVSLLDETDEWAPGDPERLARAHEAGGRRSAMLLAELEQLGRPAHAGDEELLRRLGLSRPRIVQLLKALVEAGLVERVHQGRRVLYRPVGSGAS